MGALEARQLVALGNTERAAGRLVAAVALFERAIDEDVDDPVPYLEAARTLRALGLVGTARTRLEETAERWHDECEIILELADTAAVSGDAAAALTLYLRAIELEPAVARAYLGASRQAMEEGRLTEAEDFLNHGLAVSPDGDAARPLLLESKAALLALRNQLAGAVELLEETLAETRSVKSLSPCLVELARRGRFAEALDLLQRLRTVSALYITDLPTFELRFRAIHWAKRLSEMTHERCEFDTSVKFLRLTPRPVAREQPIERFGATRSAAYGYSRYYVVERLLLDGWPKKLPSRVHELIASDLDTLTYWPKIRQTERAYFLNVIDDCFVFKKFDRYGSCLVTEKGEYISGLVSEFSPLNLARVIPLDSNCDHEGIEEVFVLPDNTGWSNYYHTVVTVLSSLVFFKRLGLSCAVVVPGQLAPFHREILDASGLGSTIRILAADELSGVAIRRAYCPTRVGGQLVREWCDDVARHQMGSGEEGPREGILYISRGQAATRQLVNETLLEDELQRRFGARIVHMENLTFEAQVRLVRSARLIVAPHGAGLTNILFASPGSWVIELLPDRHPRHGFRDLAAIGGHQYVPIIGHVERLESMEWRIDVEKVSRVAESILSQPLEHER